MINLKFAAIGVLLVSFIAFCLHYDYLKEKSKTQQIAIEQLEKIAAEKELTAKMIDAARVAANTQLEAAKDEIKKRDDCIASGACKRVVRVKSSCNLPQAETAGGVAEGFAELATDTQRNIADFEVKLAEQESKLSLCIAYARGVSSQDGK